MAPTIPYRRLALLCGILAAIPAVWAESLDRGLRAPVASRNLAPIYASLGVPVMRDAAGLEAGQWQGVGQIHWASHAVREAAKGRTLEFDGETRRYDLGLRVGLTRGLTLEFNLPWIEHEGGRLDGLIDGWHDLWHMPEGPRPEQPQDALRFAYSGDGGFVLDSAASGPGDAEVGVSWQFARADGAELAAFAQTKLPTGAAKDFTGSGETAYAAGLRASAQTCVSARLSCHAQIGVVSVGDLTYAPDADTATWFGGISLAWTLMDSLALVGQVDAQGKVYTQNPLAINGDPVWGTLGLRWAPGRRWLIEAHFSEDLAVASAPDITFLLGVSHNF